MPFGAETLGLDGVRFRLWAPSREAVELELLAGDGRVGRRLPMQAQPGGWHEAVAADARAGALYRYRVGADLAVPDPASRFNPGDVHGASQVVDPQAYVWQHADWCGLPWHTATVCEVHVGCYTPEGTFAALTARLPQLHALGITTVQLMPVADFSGARSWGYDGVLPFAPDASYGRPEDLKRLVDAAHALGMMVMLDVVYNHFGPEGNYLHAYCPEFFNTERQTPWGPAINVDGPGSETVRRFFIDNALYWVEEYRLDGLRLDAVHAIRDDSGQHLVAEIADALRRGPGRERRVHLVLENDDNIARWLLRDGADQPLVATAQWNDDLHHAAHVLVTGETDGYYADYAQAPTKHLGCSLAAGFVYQGQASALRAGKPRGEPSALLPSQAFVSFLQNHDQIGNRAFGERLDALASTEHVEALLACLLLSPHVPMLFMGEEFAASSPFLYFCDFHGDLGEAVASGRRGEFAGFPAFGDAEARERIPDPNAISTFAASKLRWEECDTPRGRRRLALVERLLSLRKEFLTPLLPMQRHGGALQGSGEGWFSVEWCLGRQVVWCLRANVGVDAVDLPTSAAEQEIFRTHRWSRPASGVPIEQPVAENARLRLHPGEVQVATRPGASL